MTPLEQMGDKYVYDRKQFTDINESKFVERIKKIEDEKMNDNKWAFDGVRFPLVLILGSLIIYHTWQTIPYGKAYEHFSHSEYIPRENHLHAIFLGNLSFSNTSQLMLYFPIMVGSLVLTAKFFKQKHTFLLFMTNSLLTYGITYAYERSKKVSPMITPKVHGGATALALLGAQFGLAPNLLIMGQRAMPFFIIPATMFMYEFWEYQNGYVNEVCRPAHLGSFVYGVLFGIIFRRYFYVAPRKVF